MSASDDVFLREVAVEAEARFPTPVMRLDPYRELRRNKQGLWVGRLRFPRWNAAGSYRLGVWLEDGAQRLTLRGGDPSSSDGPLPGPGTITVRGGRVDQKAPQVSFTQGPASVIDARVADQAVTVQVRVRDSESGVTNVGMNWGLGDRLMRLRRISGTRHDGLWQAQLQISHCRRPPSKRLTVWADDAAGRRGFRGHPVSVLVADHTGPSVRSDNFHPRRTGPLRFTWTEDTAGLSLETAPLVRDDADAPPARVAGTWSCLDAAGAPADCFAGPVRTSVFTASARLAGDLYRVLVNPPGTLAVTDLAGNPAHRFAWVAGQYQGF